jgi:hypothetical protein
MTIILSNESNEERSDSIDDYYKGLFDIDIARRVLSPSQRSGNLIKIADVLLKRIPILN